MDIFNINYRIIWAVKPSFWAQKPEKGKIKQQTL